MPLDKKTAKEAVWNLTILIALGAMFGFILPALISAKSNEAVVLGIGVIAILLGYVYYVIFKRQQ